MACSTGAMPSRIITRWHRYPPAHYENLDTGLALELTRTIDASREDVWASLTESPERRSGSGPGSTSRRTRFVSRCASRRASPRRTWPSTPASRPADWPFETIDEMQWQLEVRLVERDDSTVVVLVHRCESTDGLGDIGPGWEYYLDMFIASRHDDPLPRFADYYPAQQVYYSSLRPR